MQEEVATSNNTEGRIFTAPFIILTLANFFQSMGLFMTNTTLPLYLEELGAQTGIIGVVIGSFAATALLVRPFAGPAFDSFSRKKLLMFSQTVVASALFLYGRIDTVQGLFALRLFHGLGAGFGGPVALSLVSEYLPAKKFASGVSIYMLSQSVAQVIGPAVGLQLIEMFGFRLTYSIAAALLLFSLLSISRVKEIPRQRLPYQLKLSRMFVAKVVDKAVVIMFLAIAFGATTSYLVLYAEKLGIENVSMYFVIYATCLMVTRPLFGKIADTIGTERVLVAGLLAFMSAYLLLTRMHTFTDLVIVAVVASAGFGACMPLTQSLALSSVSVEHRGAAGNTSYTGMDLGTIIGPIIAGYVIEWLEPITGSLLSAYSYMWYFMLIPQSIALLIVISWNFKLRKNKK